MVPQTDFLRFITGEAARYPNFRLAMGASARKLIGEEGEVRGVPNAPFGEIIAWNRVVRPEQRQGVTVPFAPHSPGSAEAAVRAGQ